MPGKWTANLDQRPSCALCEHPAIADAATVQGPWGYLCQRHFDMYGRGLGTGVGQVLLCGDEVDDRLIAKYNLQLPQRTVGDLELRRRERPV